MMTLARNPYVAGNPVGDSSAFVGREDVLREVLRVLRQDGQNAIVLYGQRRIGKTSILQQLVARLPEEGPYCPVYFDLQDKAALPLGQVLQDLARTIADALDQPEPDLGPEPEAAFRDVWLPTLLDSLPEGHAIVLLLDEFDVLTEPQAEQAASAFFPYLRGLLASDPGRLQFEFVIGRNIDDLDHIALSVFKGTPARRITLLSREDFPHLVRLSEDNGTLHWPDDAVEQVWQWTHGHPFLTQQLCSHVWERAYDEEPAEAPTATPDAVDAVVSQALDASRNTMEWLWDGLPPAERVVASALAEAGSAAITPEGLERLLHESGVRVVIRELQSAPQLLQDWDLIEPADGGYRFRVELLRQWIAQSKPLQRVQEELDHIQPVAENLYQAAQGLYQGGQLQQAVDLLRQAVALNPNHVRANQLLADILLAQGEAGEAEQLLERLYEYQPAAARPRLIQALLVLANQATTGDEQLELYERVLAFNPDQPEALSGKREIWEQRGDAALEAGDLETALECYEMAGITDKTGRVAEEMNRRALAAELQVLERVEQEGAYEQALDIAHKLAERYPDYRDWASDLERLERKTKLRDLYQRGLGALQSDDPQTAQTLLAQVVALEPGYKEATRYLHLAVTGDEVAGPRAEAQDDEMEDHPGLERARWLQLNLEHLGPWLPLALIASNWVLLAGFGLFMREVGDWLLDENALFIVGAYGGAITGLILALTLDWPEGRRLRVPLLGWSIGGCIIGALVWWMSLEAYSSVSSGALAMTVASAAVVLSYLLVRWWQVRAEPVTLERLTPLWLPLCLTTVGLVFFNHSGYKGLALGGVFPLAVLTLLLAWALTGWLGDRDGRWWPWVMRLTAFNVAAWLLIDFGWKYEYWDPVLFHGMVIVSALAVGVALGITRVASKGLANLAADFATGVLAGLMVGGAFALFILGEGLMAAGIVGGALGFGLAFWVSRLLEPIRLGIGQPSWLIRGARLAVVVLLLCFLFAIVSIYLLWVNGNSLFYF